MAFILLLKILNFGVVEVKIQDFVLSPSMTMLLISNLNKKNNSKWKNI